MPRVKERSVFCGLLVLCLGRNTGRRKQTGHCNGQSITRTLGHWFLFVYGLVFGLGIFACLFSFAFVFFKPLYKWFKTWGGHGSLSGVSTLVLLWALAGGSGWCCAPVQAHTWRGERKREEKQTKSEMPHVSYWQPWVIKYHESDSKVP